MGNELEDQGQALAPAAGADAAGAQDGGAGSGVAQQTALPRPAADASASVDGNAGGVAPPPMAQDGQPATPVQSTPSGQSAGSGGNDGGVASASPGAGSGVGSSANARSNTATDAGTNASANAATDASTNVGGDAGTNTGAAAGTAGDAAPPPSSLECRFCGLDGEPIVGAQYRFAVDGQDVSGTTDGNGCAQTLQNLTPNANCTVSIKRDDGTYKQIASFAVPTTDGYVTLMSPSAMLESQSELHGGNPDDAYKESPPADGAAGGAAASSGGADGKGGGSDAAGGSDANAGAANTGPASATNANAGSADTTSQQNSTKSASSAQPASPTTSQASSTPPAPKQPSSSAQAHPPAKPSAASTAHNGGTGKAPQPKTVENKRDALGHPQAKPAESMTDWVDRKVMGAWHYVEGLFGLKTNPVTAAIQGAKPAAGTKPAGTQAGAQASASADAASAAAQGAAHVATLMQIAEEQSLHLMSTHTVDNISALSKGTFKYLGNKGAADSVHKCYVFVKVALWRAKYVSGVLGGVSAKIAGPYLEEAGFKNVTDELPDARWAWPGDVIVYAVHGDTTPNTDRVGPDGHIDIRTYHHYISDFRRNHLFFHGGVNRSFDVVGIYRKPGFSDPAVTARVKAFLKVIRSRECSTLYERFGDKYTYGAKYGALTPGDCIKDFSKHPGSVGGHSPAGAYELTEPTWTSGWHDNGMPKDFSPPTQDRYAVWRMDMRWENMNDQSTKTALGYVRLGDLDNAVRLLRPEWAALPGTSQSRGYTMEQLRADYNTFLKEFQS
jgi:muramidase (phage lysozyme)